MNISKTADVALIALKRNFIEGFEIGNIKIDTITYKVDTKYGKRDRNVSTIEIHLKKTQMRNGL